MQGQDLHHSPLLDLRLDIIDGVRRFDLNRDGLAGECLDEDLCAAAQQDYGMEPHTCTQHGAVYGDLSPSVYGYGDAIYGVGCIIFEGIRMELPSLQKSGCDHAL